MSQNELDLQKQKKYQEELGKAERIDYSKSWVSSSRFLFYLCLACLILITWGGCYRLYVNKYEKPKVQVQESTLYTPQYK
jgi:hypothetical protein